MTRAQLEQYAREAAQVRNIPVRGFLALVGQESGWDPNAVSPRGYMGLTQIGPPAMADTGITGNPFDPIVNLSIGAAYLIWVRNWLGANNLPSSWPYVLAGYNAGIGTVQDAVEEHGENWLAHMPAETRHYVAVLAPEFESTLPIPEGSGGILLAVVAGLVLWFALQ